VQPAFLVNERAQFEWIVSRGSMQEAHEKGDREQIWARLTTTDVTSSREVGPAAAPGHEPRPRRPPDRDAALQRPPHSWRCFDTYALTPQDGFSRRGKVACVALHSTSQEELVQGHQQIRVLPACPSLSEQETEHLIGRKQGSIHL
jgi:hypothetical protein